MAEHGRQAVLVGDIIRYWSHDKECEQTSKVLYITEDGLTPVAVVEPNYERVRGTDIKEVVSTKRRGEGAGVTP